MTRKRLTAVGSVLLVVVLLAVAAVAGVRWWRDSHRSDLERAMSMSLDEAQRLSWTDWAAYATSSTSTCRPTPPRPRSPSSSTAGSRPTSPPPPRSSNRQPVMHVQLGFSPASVDWELFTQSETAAVITVGLPDSTDYEAITDNLDRLGFVAPSKSTGIWEASPDVLARIGTVSPELTFIAIDADQHVIVTSDTKNGAAAGLDAAEAEHDPRGGLGDVVRSIDEAGTPLSGAFYTGDQVCAALSMGQADTVEQDQAAELILAAGDINPLAGFAMTMEPGGDLRVAMGFETEEQARTNATTRAALAAGPAPGQGGEFSDRFTLGRVACHRVGGDHGADAPRGQLRAVRPVERAAALRHLLAIAQISRRGAGGRGTTPRITSTSSWLRWTSDSEAAMIRLVVSSTSPRRSTSSRVTSNWSCMISDPLPRAAFRAIVPHQRTAKTYRSN